MFSLLQAHRAGSDVGVALPTVFRSFERWGARLIRGQLSLCAAPAGTGKSALGLTMALKSGVSVLYLSADSDSHVQTSRTISILTGAPLAESQEWTRSQTWPAEVGEALGQNLFFRWDFTPSPTVDDVEAAVACYFEIYGEFPHLIVVDNVTNIRGTSAANADDPFSGLESLMDYLHSMARETGAHVLGLHHTTAAHNDSSQPIPLSGVKGQISRVPALIITLHKAGEKLLGASVVKNRNGRSDAGGHLSVELEADLSRMAIRDPTFPAAQWASQQR
ncbi:AAA family ATPase [Glycomyces sp. NPDC048151]|uniref:AAA family ATPase n=1 Tax=Glycomyces sp. NPDC048151 TaxID=3364002 RepID=UPI003722D549